MLLRGQPSSGTPGSVSNGIDLPQFIHIPWACSAPEGSDLPILISSWFTSLRLFWKGFPLSPSSLSPSLGLRDTQSWRSQTYSSPSPKRPRQRFPNQDLLQHPLGGTCKNRSQILLTLIGIFLAAKGVTAEPEIICSFACSFAHSIHVFKWKRCDVPGCVVGTAGPDVKRNAFATGGGGSF